MSIALFDSFIEAITYVVDKHGINYFTVTDCAMRPTGRAQALVDIETVAVDTAYQPTPGFVRAMIDLEMDEDAACVVELGAEAHYGYVVCHYEKDGTPIKFIGVRCN